MQEQKAPICQRNNGRPQAVRLDLSEFQCLRRIEPRMKTPTLLTGPVVEEAVKMLGGDLEAVFLQSVSDVGDRGQPLQKYFFHIVLHELERHQEEIDRFHAEAGIYKDMMFIHKQALVQFHEVEVFNRAATELGGLNPNHWQEIYRYRSLKAVVRPSRKDQPGGRDDFPTEDHAEAFDKIVELAQLHFDWEVRQEIEALCGGIRMRTFPLVTGPSACGKTFIARALAQKLDAKLNLISVGNWIPQGADVKPCSMVSIMSDMLNHERVVLFIDEIDKTEENSEQNTWSISNRMDIYALLDDNVHYDKLMEQLRRFSPKLASRVSEESIDCQQLASERLFIIGAGTWQREHQQANSGKTSLGFSESVDEAMLKVDMQERLMGNRLIAEELRNRFNHELIELRHPTVEEGRALLDRKGVTALAERLGRMDLIEGIDWPNGGLRNVESIVAELAIGYRRLGASPRLGDSTLERIHHFDALV